jgi:hypothetical protein
MFGFISAHGILELLTRLKLPQKGKYNEKNRCFIFFFTGYSR